MTMMILKRTLIKNVQCQLANAIELRKRSMKINEKKRDDNDDGDDNSNDNNNNSRRIKSD